MRGKVRIIGGKWRGRIIKVAPRENLRPTLDRVRETLFNWLRPHIHNTKCLDCFAGSGILGLEAMSQGAESVTFIEKDEPCIKVLRESVSILEVESKCNIIRQDVLSWLVKQKFTNPFDVIFLDPPYDKDLFTPTLKLLQQSESIGPNTLIYFEDNQPLSKCPDNFSILKQAKAGMVTFHLIQRSA
jgi:16S rRNA (guanine966-N2)-methyltransferase